MGYLLTDRSGAILARYDDLLGALAASRDLPDYRYLYRGGDHALLAYRVDTRGQRPPAPRPAPLRLVPRPPPPSPAPCPVWGALATPATFPALADAMPHVDRTALGRRVLWLLDHGHLTIRAQVLARGTLPPPWSPPAPTGDDPSRETGKVSA